VRLAEALERRPGRGPFLVPYLMVDRTRTRSLRATIEALRDAGAAAVELGFPFSDPIADGPVLAAAGARALRHGTEWEDLLAWVRTSSKLLPTAVMTYANPIWTRRLTVAFDALRSAGATGLIVPDLSWEESPAWRNAAQPAGLDLVLLAAPGMSAARLRSVARDSRGFLYLVGRYGTTGAGSTDPPSELRGLVEGSHQVAPHLAVLIGFGIRDRASRDRALASGADGVIVGTALEERIARGRSPASWVPWLRAFSAEPDKEKPTGGLRTPRRALHPT
jgi:tryptophan synthase alpha chain